MPPLRCPIDGRFLTTIDLDGNHKCTKCGQKYSEGGLGQLECTKCGMVVD